MYMSKDEMIYTATLAFNKSMSRDELYYSDYMYGSENLTNEVWEYVIELREIGKQEFYEKYRDYSLY